MHQSQHHTKTIMPSRKSKIISTIILTLVIACLIFLATLAIDLVLNPVASSTIVVKFVASISIVSIYYRLLCYVSKSNYSAKIFSMYCSFANIALIIVASILFFVFEKVETKYLMAFNFLFLHAIFEIFNISKQLKIEFIVHQNAKRLCDELLATGYNWYYFVDFKDCNYTTWTTSTSKNKYKASSFLYDDTKKVMFVECQNSKEFELAVKNTIYDMFYNYLNNSEKMNVDDLSKFTSNNENHVLKSSEIFIDQNDIDNA